MRCFRIFLSPNLPSLHQMIRHLAVAVLICMPLSAWARVNETVAQCDARYVKVTKRFSATIPGSDPEAVVYDKDGFLVVVHFKQGKAWHVAYSKERLSLNDSQRFLRANGQNESWGNPEGFQRHDRRYWRARALKYSAVLYHLRTLSVLECMTDECRKAVGEVRQESIRQAMRRSMELPMSKPVTSSGEKTDSSQSSGNPTQPVEKNSGGALDLKGF
jgi:hypothetical protein